MSQATVTAHFGNGTDSTVVPLVVGASELGAGGSGSVTVEAGGTESVAVEAGTDASVSETVGITASVTVVPPAPVTVAVSAGVQGPVGPTGPAGGVDSVNGRQGAVVLVPGDVPTYTHSQGVPASIWTITHGMNCRPSITVVDSSGRRVQGFEEYLSANEVRVTFSAAFSGSAYLN